MEERSFSSSCLCLGREGGRQEGAGREVGRPFVCVWPACPLPSSLPALPAQPPTILLLPLSSQRLLAMPVFPAMGCQVHMVFPSVCLRQAATDRSAVDYFSADDDRMGQVAGLVLLLFFFMRLYDRYTHYFCLSLLLCLFLFLLLVLQQCYGR